MDLKEAAALALSMAPRPVVEDVGLQEALGRVLGRNIAAGRDIPAEARSRLDGFAVRSEDLAGAAAAAPVSLRVLAGIFPAGCASESTVGPGWCARVLTGAPVPCGADLVIPQEKVFRRDDLVILEEPFPPGHGLIPGGGDILESEALLGAGEVLGPTRLALIAALGHVTVPVYRKPRVALLATGDEVRELGESLDGPWTYCNNRQLLAALVVVHGAEAVQLGVAKDNPASIEEQLRHVAADLVISTGGMGRGDRDYVLDAWNNLGVELHFSDLNISPGKRSALGSRGRQLLWGLPGNPWAAQLVFEELVAPVLWKTVGIDRTERPQIRAVLTSAVKKKKGLYLAVRGFLGMSSTPPTFTPVAGGEGSLFSRLRNSFAYTLLAPHVVEVAAGNEIHVRLHDFPLLARPILCQTDFRVGDASTGTGSGPILD